MTDRVALAIDLGGTKVEAALVTEHGRVVAGTNHRRPTGRDSTADAAAGSVGAVVDAALAGLGGATLVGAGIGAAGPVDLRRGTIAPLNLPGLAGFAIVETVARRLPADLPVRLRLDGPCIALAEHVFGAAAAVRDSLSLVVSTGVGGGVVVDDRLLAGAHGNATHLGQVRLGPRDDDPAWDAGTVEAIASGPRSVAWARHQGWTGRTGEDLAHGYASGEPIAVAAVRRSAGAIGGAIGVVATLLDIEVAVVAGGFAGVAPDYLDLVRAALRDSAVLDFAREVRVEPSGLHGSGPLIGAAALVLRPDLLAG